MKNLPAFSENVWKWLEVILGTALVIGAVGYFRPADPLLLKLNFPWLILLPMLLALYYGSAAGGASLAMIGGWQWLRDLLHTSPYEVFPVEFLVGSFLVVLVAGQFSELWSARDRRLSNVCAYSEDRLVRLTRDYYILKLAHDKLVQMFATKPATIRDALFGVRKLVCDLGPVKSLAGGDSLLELLVHHYQLSRAGLYRCSGTVASAELIASAGAMEALAVNDPLVQFALAKGTMVHINAQDMESVEDSRYLLAMPMLDHNDMLIGLFVVADMPFPMMHEENLTAIQVIISYYVADIDLSLESGAIMEEFPLCPRDFSDEMVRLHRVVRGGGAPSRLVAFACSDEAFPILEGIKNIQRGLDFTWFVSIGYRHALIVLMPLADEFTVKGYLFRVEQWLKEQHGISMEKAGIIVRFALLREAEPTTYLHYTLRQCGLTEH